MTSKGWILVTRWMGMQFNKMRNTGRKGLCADGYSGMEMRADVY